MTGLYVDYDTDRWLYVPNRFPWSDFADEEQWAPAAAEVFNRGPKRRRPPAELLDWLRAYLTGAVRNNIGGAIRYLHLPTLESPTMIVDMYESPIDTLRTVEDLTGQSSNQRLARPIDVARFDSPHLGRGVKSTRLVVNDDESIIWASNWVWRLEDRDILMLTGATELPVAEAMNPILDDLARGIRTA